MTRTGKIIFLIMLLPACVVAGILVYAITWEYECYFKAITFNRNGDAMLTLENGSEILLWDVTAGRDVRAMRKPYLTEGADHIAFSPDGRKAVSGGTDGVILWDIDTGRMLHVFEGSCPLPANSSGPCVAFTPDGGFILAGDSEFRLILWNAEKYTMERTFVYDPAEQKTAAERDVRCISFAPDGRTVLTAGDRLVLWNVKSGRRIRIFDGHKKAVISAAITSDGQHIVSGAFDETLKIWSLELGEEISSLQLGHYPQSIAFSPDGRYALTGETHGGLKAWDMKKGVFRFTLNGSEKGVLSIAVSPDNAKVVAGLNGTMKMWDLHTGKELLTFRRNPTFSLIMNDLVWAHVKI